MLRVSLKGLWAHKRRLFGTVFAVLLGVTFLVGTLVLGDTMRAGFNDLFTEVNRGTDAVVRNASEISSQEGGQQRGLIDISLVDTIREVDGVRAAAPSVLGFGQIVGKNGNPIGGNGPPTIAASWTEDPQLNPWTVADGNPPEANGEVAIDRRVAKDEDIAIGDTIVVLTPDPTSVKVVGILTIGGEDSLGAVTFAAFTFEQAQDLFMPSTQVASEIDVSAENGVSQEQLVENLKPVLPNGVEAITGDELTKENNDDINEQFLGFFETFLLVFAFIALVVACFSIYNTFTILVAQRTRESALLRAIGASRGQVLASIALESLAIGLVASILGLLAGIGLAAGLRSLFDALGFGVPTGAITVKPSTIVYAFAVGLVVTLIATLFPAIRASRVPPLAALRDVAVEKLGISKIRLVLGIVFAAIGVALVISVAVRGGDILPAGVGALLTIIGVVILGPIAARPASSVLGRPIAAVRRMSGRLARENAMRNPRRTAATASALMVGIAVVTLFTVFAASLKAAIDDTVSKQFGGDLVIMNENFSGAGLSPQMTQEIAQLPEVSIATAQGVGQMRLDEKDVQISNIDPKPFSQLIDLDVKEGSVADLTDDQVAVSEKAAKDENFELGQKVTGEFISDNAKQEFTIGAIYGSNQLVGNYVLTKDAWDAHAPQPSDLIVMIELADGVSIAEGKQAVQQVADKFFAPDVQDRDEFIKSQAEQINIFLTIIYALLVLAIIIALFGIANTLSLSVYERIRELGLLRAVGQTRSQLRSMVRWESVIIAVFGTFGGILVGLFLGWGIVKVVARAEDFPTPYTVPFGQLIGVLIVGAFVGLLAGWRPARRASKLNILEAIATE
jgi:putative ABC transport system permease protein